MESERIPAYFGIKQETSGHNMTVHGVSRFFVELFVKIGHINIKGSLPKEGPGFAVANHASGRKDPVFIHLLAARTGRTIRCVSRQDFIENPLFGWFFQSFHPIGVSLSKINRNGVDPKFLQELDGEFQEGRLVGMFPSGRENSILDLGKLQRGAATIVLRNPEIDIIPIGISGTRSIFHTPVSVRVGKPFRIQAEELRWSTEEELLGKVNDIIADKIAEQVEDKDLIPGWRLRKCGLSPLEIKRIASQARKISKKWGFEINLARIAKFAEKYGKSHLLNILDSTA